MNIAEAKEQIKRTVTVYLTRDRYGAYRIPIARQRPVFLLGAPGIGKTAIMEQLAHELDIALVSYSMTHHTRQSALGLPVIRQSSWQGRTFDVTEYTMSEIIAAIYEAMSASGKTEGILFLDEINCVSETLAPAMLQFLQYKTFGTHRIPEGWVIVTAGNPPQFNRSVREFDVAMLDRLKVLEVEPDYDVWRSYAADRSIHSAVLTYLDIRKDDFYRMENTSDGRSYTTARGWEDLSETMYLYEDLDYPIDETLIAQYLRSKDIVREFSSYYALYRKYREDYRIPDILTGKETESVRERARAAAFDERVSLVNLLLDAVQRKIRDNAGTEQALRLLLPTLKKIKTALSPDERTLSSGDEAFSSADVFALAQRSLSEETEALRETLERQRRAGSLSSREEKSLLCRISILEEEKQAVRIAAKGADRALFRAADAAPNAVPAGTEGADQNALPADTKDAVPNALPPGTKDAVPNALPSGAAETVAHTESASDSAFSVIRSDYSGRVAAMQAEADEISGQLSHLFGFIEEVYGEQGSEMLLVVNSLTADYSSAYFLSNHPCEAYYRHSRHFAIYGREKELQEALNDIDLRDLDNSARA
ncbi:MAG: MoxR family ATPase [Eubacteriales bacterium]|nr:MoxR family ATPase [Eubacteriales bacterium]